MNTSEAVQPGETSTKYAIRLPQLLIFTMMILLLVSPLWYGYLTIVDYHNRTIPNTSKLESLSFKIIRASERIPNFKVEFKDGTATYLSFPDFLAGNGKSGLRFPQITQSDRNSLVGCEAVAKVNYVPWWIFNKKQIWDLTCSGAHIHYGPSVAGSKIAESPESDLVLRLIVAGMVFFISWHRIIGYFLKKFSNVKQ